MSFPIPRTVVRPVDSPRGLRYPVVSSAKKECVNGVSGGNGVTARLIVKKQPNMIFPDDLGVNTQMDTRIAPRLQISSFTSKRQSHSPKVQSHWRTGCQTSHVQVEVGCKRRWCRAESCISGRTFVLRRAVWMPESFLRLQRETKSSDETRRGSTVRLQRNRVRRYSDTLIATLPRFGNTFEAIVRLLSR